MMPRNVTLQTDIIVALRYVHMYVVHYIHT